MPCLNMDYAVCLIKTKDLQHMWPVNRGWLFILGIWSHVWCFRGPCFPCSQLCNLHGIYEIVHCSLYSPLSIHMYIDKVTIKYNVYFSMYEYWGKNLFYSLNIANDVRYLTKISSLIGIHVCKRKRQSTCTWLHNCYCRLVNVKHSLVWSLVSGWNVTHFLLS